MQSPKKKIPPKLTEKQRLFCKYYYTPGSETFGNGVQSAKLAGYKGNDNVLTQIANKMVRNGKIGKERDKIQAECEDKINISRDYCLNGLVGILSDVKSNNRDKISAYSLIADLCGYKRDTAPNEEREARRKAKTAEEAEALRQLAINRTEQKATLHIVRGGDDDADNYAVDHKSSKTG